MTEQAEQSSKIEEILRGSVGPLYIGNVMGSGSGRVAKALLLGQFELERQRQSERLRERKSGFELVGVRADHLSIPCESDMGFDAASSEKCNTCFVAFEYRSVFPR